LPYQRLFEDVSYRSKMVPAWALRTALDRGALDLRSQADVLDEHPTHLRDYIALLRTHKWLIVIVTVVIVGVVLGLSLRQTPIYASQADVLVKPIDTSASGLPPPPPNLETERTLATSETVARIAARRLDYSGDVDDFLEKVSVGVATSTEILQIRFSDPSKEAAQRGAQELAEAYLDYRRREALDEIVSASQTVTRRIDARTGQLEEVRNLLSNTRGRAERTELKTEADALETQIAILQQQLIDVSPAEQLNVGQVVGPADVPTDPISPNYSRNLLLAFLVGLGLGVGAAFLRERLDDRLRGRDELETVTGSPVLAVVPRVPFWKKGQTPLLISLAQPQSAAAEAYKTLRTSVLYAAQQNGLKVLLITSPQAGEGKTATTANLGVALAQAGKQVIMVSADLRKPRLHLFFDASNTVGLTDVLEGRQSAFDVLATNSESLRILPSGTVPANPAELLGSDAMGRSLKNLREVADFVLIDAPPLLAVTDAVALAPFADGVLFVADAATTTRGSIKHALKQLEAVNAPLIGAVLNNFDPARGPGYGYYGYRSYYTYESGDRTRVADGNGSRLSSRLPRRRSNH
jgi:succinoglycan biosynthesis transport protein ExoP